MVELSGCPVAKSTTRAAFPVKRILWPIEILVQSRLLGRRARVWSRRDAGRPRGGSCKLKSGLGKTPRCVIARIAGSRVYRRAATGKHPPGPKAFSIIGSLSVDGSQCFLRCFSVRPVYSAFQRVEFSEVFSLPFLHFFLHTPILSTGLSIASVIPRVLSQRKLGDRGLIATRQASK